MGIIKAVLVVLTLTMTLGSLWYWALFGMNRDVGLAWQMTVLLMYSGTSAVFLYDYHRRSR